MHLFHIILVKKEFCILQLKMFFFEYHYFSRWILTISLIWPQFWPERWGKRTEISDYSGYLWGGLGKKRLKRAITSKKMVPTTFGTKRPQVRILSLRPVWVFITEHSLFSFVNAKRAERSTQKPLCFLISGKNWQRAGGFFAQKRQLQSLDMCGVLW